MAKDHPYWEKALQVFWAISTYGCVFSLMGIIWFIATWVMYELQGNDRPFNILQHKALQGNGTPTPMIRYAATHLYQAYRPNANDPLSSKIKAFIGYGGQTESYSYESSVDHIPFTNGTYDNTTTIIVIRPSTNIESIMYAVDETTFRDTLAKIGGLIGIIASVIIFLFGHTRLSPWGILARFPPFRTKIINGIEGRCKKNEEDKMSEDDEKSEENENNENEKDGVNEKDGESEKNGENEKNEKNEKNVRPGAIFTKRYSTTDSANELGQLHKRLDELEVVLEDYYLDGKFFRESFKKSGRGESSTGRGPSTGGGRAEENSNTQQPAA
ncbi:hypothetical protein BGZ80_011699 [Entomortierella chlamydospora]|uniref:Uncharacterized protein n=1 Tax=Entomortierella chlamydospora TaxID=101097 RepID=A0A9P6MU56_9FUNG|nr:hypothetical protein BGZ80_011699 [Entomortierella chlamydospora]